MDKLWFSSLIQATVATVLVLCLVNVVSAQVRTSNNYQLQSDSLNVGGGYSSSTSYRQESTVGEAATGMASSSNYSLRAGYQQMQEVFLSLSITGAVVMSPDILGLTGGTSNGSTTVTVVTDSPSGYTLTVSAEGEPAMQSGSETISDYDAGAFPDFSFITSGSDAHFGFTPEGVDIVAAFQDDGGTCGTGGTSDAPLACWDGLATTTTTIAEDTNSTHPDGATTTVNFRVGVGSGAGVIAGVYIATTTFTALPL